MRINSFLINFKSKKLWYIMSLAIFVSFFLIFTVISLLSKTPNGMKFENLFEMLSKNELFNLKSYHSNAEITVISNKNRNVYNIDEWYQKSEDGKEMFRFDIKNSDGSITTYIFKDNTLQVKNTGQLATYILNDYVVKKTNLTSFMTFISIYDDAKEYKDKFFKVEEIEDDDKLCLKVIFSNINDMKQDQVLYQKYQDIFDSGIKLKKMELIIDKQKNLPVVLNIYDSKDKILIDIDYKAFEVNPKIEQKVFDF